MWVSVRSSDSGFHTGDRVTWHICRFWAGQRISLSQVPLCGSRNPEITASFCFCAGWQASRPRVPDSLCATPPTSARIGPSRRRGFHGDLVPPLSGAGRCLVPPGGLPQRPRLDSEGGFWLRTVKPRRTFIINYCYY